MRILFEFCGLRIRIASVPVRQFVKDGRVGHGWTILQNKVTYPFSNAWQLKVLQASHLPTSSKLVQVSSCCSCLVTALGVAGALTRWTQGSSRTRYRTSGWGIWAWSSRRRRRPCTRPSYASRRRASSQSLLLLLRRRRRCPDRWATHFRRWFDRFDKKKKERK